MAAGRDSAQSATHNPHTADSCQAIPPVSPQPSLSRAASACRCMCVCSSSLIASVVACAAVSDKLKVRSFIEMYTAEDSPMPFWSSQPAQPSYIDVDFRFTTINGSTPQSAAAQLEVAIFRATYGQVEYTYQYPAEDGQTVATSCCARIRHMLDVDERKRDISCPTESSLYLNSDFAHDIERYVVEFNDGATSAALKERYDIQETGEHFLIIADCSLAASDNAPIFPTGVEVIGRTVWMNPYGHLMGRLYGYLPFYAIMTAVFTAAFLIWTVYYVCFYASIAPIQHCILAVLTLCLIESGVWLVNYEQWNETGTRNVPLIIAAIMLTVSRLTLSRMLVVAVSLGWGVVRPSLGNNTWKLIALGLLYFVCEGGLELVQRYSPLDADAEKWRLALIVPVSVLNSVFYWWMFLSLHRLLSFLDARKQEAKLHIYKQLTAVLLASLLAAVAYASYQIYFSLQQKQMENWNQLYLLDQGAPFIIYTVILLTIAALWRPSAEGKQYHYSQLQAAEQPLNDDEEDEHFGVSKNVRGEAADSDDDEEEDAQLDDDTDDDENGTQQLQREDDTTEKSTPQPVQKVRAQFSIGGDDDEQRGGGTAVSSKPPTVPALNKPEEGQQPAVANDVTITVAQPAVGSGADSKSSTKSKKAKEGGGNNRGGRGGAQ